MLPCFGITQQPSTLSDCDCIVQFFAKHFTVVRVKAQLDQMIDGLKALGIYDLIKANPRSMHKLFTSNAIFPGGLQQEGGRGAGGDVLGPFPQAAIIRNRVFIKDLSLGG